MFFFNLKVCCAFSLESPHRGDSNEYTKYTISNIKKKITLHYPIYAAMGFFQETHERVRNSRGKRAISVRPTEVVFYFSWMRVFVNIFIIFPIDWKRILSVLLSLGHLETCWTSVSLLMKYFTSS